MEGESPNAIEGCEFTCLLFRRNFNNDEVKSYAKPILFLDLLWNVAFILLSLVVLSLAVREKPSIPLRIWVSGYVFQCLFHVGLIFYQYRKVLTFDWDDENCDCDFDVDLEGGGSGWLSNSSHSKIRFIKRVEAVSTLVSSLWWVLGFYWIVMGGQTLMQDSPRLYWLTVVYLAFDVFFILFCLGMAFVALLAFCCCIPVLAVAYAVSIREGASEEEIRSLPKYRYSEDSRLSSPDNNWKQQRFQVKTESRRTDSAVELALLPEDSECCICLSRYVNGTDLYALPCGHHFHCGCISKWLKINATCPLCKFDIRMGDTLV